MVTCEFNAPNSKKLGLLNSLKSNHLVISWLAMTSYLHSPHTTPLYECYACPFHSDIHSTNAKYKVRKIKALKEVANYVFAKTPLHEKMQQQPNLHIQGQSYTFSNRHGFEHQPPQKLMSGSFNCIWRQNFKTINNMMYDPSNKLLIACD